MSLRGDQADGPFAWNLKCILKHTTPVNLAIYDSCQLCCDTELQTNYCPKKFLAWVNKISKLLAFTSLLSYDIIPTPLPTIDNSLVVIMAIIHCFGERTPSEGIWSDYCTTNDNR